MSNQKKSLTNRLITASFLGLMITSTMAHADEEKVKGAEKTVQRFSEENKVERLKKIEELKKAHHEHIDELYALKAKHVEELSKLATSADLKDENAKKEFSKMFKEKNKEFRKAESDLREKFKKEKIEKMGGEYKHKMKERRERFRDDFKGEKKEKRKGKGKKDSVEE